MNRFKFLLSAAALIIIALPQPGHARDVIRAVGSSTVYPFVSTAAERFGKSGEFKTPVIESTGTGTGFKLFCDGAGPDSPDINDASRAMLPEEMALCKKNGVKEVTQVGIGYDGIVVANSVKGPIFHLTKQQIFLALGRKIPKNGVLVDNYYSHWREIDQSLPNEPIEIYGPPPTSGTRDAFVEIVMEVACDAFPEFKKAYPDKKDYKVACSTLREDKKYIDAGENDNIIVQKLESNPKALGIFGYSFLEENDSKVQGSVIEGVEPTFENITTGKYSISRSLFVYVKNSHLSVIPGLKEFLQEIVSDEAGGEEGYLVMKGLVPLHPDELKKMQTLTAGFESPKKIE